MNSILIKYPRWLRSFVHSYQMIYREPVVDGIPLIRHETLFIERPQCTGFLDAR